MAEVELIEFDGKKYAIPKNKLPLMMLELHLLLLEKENSSLARAVRGILRSVE